MLREKISAQTATLGKWLGDDRDPDRVGAILQAFRDRPGSEIRSHLEEVIREKQHAGANRLTAVSLFVATLDARSESRLLPLAEAIEDGPVLAELLRATGSRPKLAANSLLLRKVASADPDVRGQAILALADRQASEADQAAFTLLDDKEARVRAAAAQAAGKRGYAPAAGRLLNLARDPDAAVRRASLEALRRLREPKVVPLAVTALADRETVSAALEALGELGGPEQAGAVIEMATRNPSAEILAAAGQVVTRWSAKDNLSAPQRADLARALGEIHGQSGVLLAWRVLGPIKPAAAAEIVTKIVANEASQERLRPEELSGARTVLATGIDARISLGQASSPDDTWLGTCELMVSEATSVEFFAASTGLATLWLNGTVVYQREKPGVIGPYPDRFEAPLLKGRNGVLVRLSGVKGAAEFQVRFRRKTATAEQERFTLAALSRAGNPARGREVFLNAEKSLCLKCHRIGEQGERIGPELTGLGSRFSKIQ
jgi:HEAT repeat protein